MNNPRSALARALANLAFGTLYAIAAAGCEDGADESAERDAGARDGGAGTAAGTVVSVADHGAIPGDVSRDSTGPFQAAIDAVADGGGMVVVPVGVYRLDGTLTVPANIVVSGETPGPFDPPIPAGSSPAESPTGSAVLLVTATSAPFITLAGYNTAITDLLFYYPDQVDPATATAPDPYPATIAVVGAGARVTGCSFTNSYSAIDVTIGRVRLNSLHIGAYALAIQVDNAFDFVEVSDVIVHPYWALWTGLQPNNPIDEWVFDNGHGVIVKKADGIQLIDISVFARYAGLMLQPNAAGETTFGQATALQLDAVKYGVISHSTNSMAGFGIANSYFTANSNGQSQFAITLLGERPDVTRLSPSTISLTGGWIQLVPGGFAAPIAVETGGGTLRTAGVLGIPDGTTTQ